MFNRKSHSVWCIVALQYCSFKAHCPIETVQMLQFSWNHLSTSIAFSVRLRCSPDGCTTVLLGSKYSTLSSLKGAHLPPVAAFLKNTEIEVVSEACGKQCKHICKKSYTGCFYPVLQRWFGIARMVFFCLVWNYFVLWNFLCLFLIHALLCICMCLCVCVVFFPCAFLWTQRVLQGEGKGQSSRRLPEAAREAAAGGGSEGLPGLDHSGWRHRPRQRGRGRRGEQA